MMNFERGRDPKTTMRIGAAALAIKIIGIDGNLGQINYPTHENVHRILKGYEKGSCQKWTTATRRLFEEKWEFKRDDSNIRSSLKELSGNFLEYKGIIYKIPQL